MGAEAGGATMGTQNDDGGRANARVVLRAMALHAFLAGLFFFVFQHYAMKESIEISLAWAGFFAAAAALLAFKQNAR